MIKFYAGNFPLEENQSNQVFFTILTTQVRIEIRNCSYFCFGMIMLAIKHHTIQPLVWSY